MGSEFFADGKKFISSKRAAEISGYANDYIGQLCRNGKLECRLIGRTWFIDETLLLNHKNRPRAEVVTQEKSRRGLFNKSQIYRVNIKFFYMIIITIILE